MSKVFESRLRFAGRRLGVNLLIGRVGWMLLLAAGILVPVILIDRLLAVPLINGWFLGALGGILAVLVIVTSTRAWPDRMQAALEIDTRVKLKERFSTTLLLESSEDPFAQAACREARERAKGLDVHGHFPLTAPPYWKHTTFLWAVVVALAILVPQKDLLGLQKDRDKELVQQQKEEQVKTEVTTATDKVESVVERLNDPNLTESLADLGQPPEGTKPADVKREAIRKLGELGDKIKGMQNKAEFGSSEMLKKMLKGLRGSTDELTRELRSALAKGDFGQARQLMEELQKALTAGDKSEEERKQLAEQFEKLARELQALAEKNEWLEKELEKLGLDKELAKLDPEKLRQALQKAGLDNELLEKLMKEAGSCNKAGSRCSALGQALAGCSGAGGMSAGDLEELLDQLGALEALDMQLATMDASLAEIARAIAGLGEGMCDGMGGQGPFSEGPVESSGPGSGGPGRGYGARDSDSNGDTGTSKTIVKSDAGQGPAIASWYFKDAQVKGESQRFLGARC